ncbi:MAG: hydroxypyruvate isomerase [Bacteroidetes bacterium]|nr:MAG: hydroxypyruvate isomerase [Bacteroidota bacterium]
MSNRREALTKIGTIATLALSTNMMAQTGKKSVQISKKLKGNINHSVCRWCYGEIPFEQLCKAAKEIGIKSIELTGPEEWPILKKYGLTSALPWGAGMGIDKGFNNPTYHEELIKSYSEIIPKVADAGLDKIICFSGNRNGISDAQGLENCAIGIKKLLPLCEKYNITLIMELLNSKVDHKDYQCDHTAWGVELCKKIDSPYFKLLYDIYHMQIMEGDIIRTIKENIKHIGHFHTGGNPGRNEIDDSQELYYPAIMKAIVETGYKGYVAQEFIPKSKTPLESLKKCIQICDV